MVYGCERSEAKPTPSPMPALVTPIDVDPVPAEFLIGTEAQRASHAELVGQPMPGFELEDWRNGELTLDDLRGHIVLVDFWATWCAPCLVTVPERNQMQADYAGRGVVILGICGSKTGQDKYDDILAQHPMDFPTARDTTAAYGEWWRVMWMPTYALVDRDGIIRGVGLDPEKLEEALGWLLEEQPLEKTDHSDEASADMAF